MRKYKIITITATLSLGILLNAASPVDVRADDITDIAGFTELYECYQTGVMKSNIGTIANGLLFEQLYAGDKDGKAHIPNMWNNTIADGDLSCGQLIGTDSISMGKWTALISSTPGPGGFLGSPIARTKAIPWLKSMGYTPAAHATHNKPENNTCYSVDYLRRISTQSIKDARNTPIENGQTVHTQSVCVTNLNGGNITDNTTVDIVKDDAVEMITQIHYDKKKKEISLDDGGIGPFKTVYGTIDASTGKSWKSIKEKIYNILKNKRSNVEYIKNEGQGDHTYTIYNIKEFNNTDDEDYDEVNDNWVFNGTSRNAANMAINNNSNSKYTNIDDLKFTQDQKKTLHGHYFTNYFKAKLICAGDADFDNMVQAPDIVEATNISSKQCFAKAGDIAPKGSRDNPAKVNAIKPDLTWHTQYTFQELVANMTEDELLNANSVVDPNNPDNGDSTSAEREPDCHTKAGALGWIICPLIETSTNTVQMIYDDLIQPYLSIDAALFDTNEKGGKTVREVWGLFQGIANLAFVVLFLVVIFSQLTGIGIDNYGIKKILPKLIIGAVLINMSYIICQLAVDISNILGRAIASMFQQFAEGINKDLAGVSVNLYPEQATAVDNKFENVGGNTGNGSGTILLVIVCIAGVLGVKAFLAAGWAILIPVLLTALSLVIGVIFLFALLALRQAVAVILVAVSPIAFATYMLPNTKKIFNKWFEAFKGMLLAYPIASALVFGGDLVSKILLVADGSQSLTSLGLLISAALVGIAPIFFIPSVIKKSMSAISGLGLGNIGKRIQSFTDDKVHKPAAERLNRSWLNDYKLRHKEENEAIANDRRMNKKGIVARKRLAKYDGKDPAKMKGILNGGDRNRARYRQALRDEAAYAKSEADLSGSYISSLDDTSLSKRAMDGLVEGDMEKFGSAIDEIGGRDQGKLLALLTNMSEQESWKNMDTRRKTAVAAKLRGQKGNPFAQAYGKLLAQESAGNVRSFNTLAGSIQEKVKENGAANLASMDKDVYKWLNGGYNRKENEQRTIFHNYDNNGNIDNVTKSFAVDSFTSNDLAEAMGQVSGAQQDQFAQFIRTRGRQNTDAGAVSDAQLANGANAAIAAAYAGAEKEEIEAAAKSGQIESAELKRKINTTFETQINNIKKNNELASATNKGLADATGIKVGPQEVVLVGIERNTEND